MNVLDAYYNILDIIFENRTFNDIQWDMKDPVFKKITEKYSKKHFIDKAKTQRPLDATTHQLLEILFKNSLIGGYKIKSPDAMIRSLVKYLKDTCHYDAQVLLITGVSDDDEETRKDTALSVFKYILVHLEWKEKNDIAFDDTFLYVLQNCLNAYITRDTVPVKLSEQYKHIHPVSGHLYCPRASITDKIDELFENNNVVFLVGVSGSGKSEICRHYGEIGQKHNKYKNVIPLRLSENGAGDIEALENQIMHSHSASQVLGFNAFSLIKEFDLVILDNYNDPDNYVIHALMDRVPNTKIIVTSQAHTMDMCALGGIVVMDEVEKQQALFSSNVFCNYGGIKYNALSQIEKDAIANLMDLIGYHTMVSAMLGRQFLSLKQNLQEFLKKVCTSVEDAIGINYRVSLPKDSEKITLSPHALVKHLFKNKILHNNFSEIERQVLGAIILCETNTSNTELICTLIGDSTVHNLYNARTALDDLHSQGIVTLENENVYIHPLIKTLVSDSSSENTENSLAELSYDFLIHLTKNKLVETYSIENPESIATLFTRPQGWHSWVLDVLNNVMIDKMKKEIDWLDTALQDDHYFVNCKSEHGSSIYIHWDSGKELCILDACYQELPDYRYFKGNVKYADNPTFTNAILIQYSGNATPTYKIPNTVANAPVTKIGRSLFRGNSILKDVTLPEQLTRIPDYLFCNCSNLHSVTMPDSVKSIGTRAFYECTKLKNINFSKNLKYITIAAFAHCQSLEGEIIFPHGLYEIHRNAFMDCKNITRVVLPDTLDDIGGYVFDGCSLLEEIQLSSQLVKLPVGIFRKCYSLKNMHIPASVRTIDEEVFYKCQSLTSVTMDEGVEKIRGHAFYCCDNLCLVEFPASLNFVDRAAVKECPNTIIEVIPNTTADKYLRYYTSEQGYEYKYRYKT